MSENTDSTPAANTPRPPVKTTGETAPGGPVTPYKESAMGEPYAGHTISGGSSVTVPPAGIGTSTHPRPPRQEKAVSIVGFVCSIIGFLTCGITSAIGVVFSIIGLQSEPRGLAAAGFVLNLLGIVMLIYSVAFIGGMATVVNRLGTQNWQQQMAASDTSNAMGRASSLIGDQWESTGELPDEKKGRAITAQVTDGWSTPLRYETDGVSFTLISNGPDRDADTSDDIIYGPFLTVEESRQIQFIDDPFTVLSPTASIPAGEYKTEEELEEDSPESEVPAGEEAPAQFAGDEEMESTMSSPPPQPDPDDQ